MDDNGTFNGVAVSAHVRRFVNEPLIGPNLNLLASVLRVFWIIFNRDWLDQGPIQPESSGQPADPITSVALRMRFLNPAVDLLRVEIQVGTRNLNSRILLMYR